MKPTVLFVNLTSLNPKSTTPTQYTPKHIDSFEAAVQIQTDTPCDMIAVNGKAITTAKHFVKSIQEKSGANPPIIFVVADYEQVLEGTAGTIPAAALNAALNACARLWAQQAELKARQSEYETELIELRARTERRTETEIDVLKNAIVKNVSHELKTPLLHVKSAVALLSEGGGDTRKLIEYASSATTRLETIVKNITMLGDSLEINPGPVIVREAIDAARRSLRRTWESRDHTERIKVTLAPELPPVLADKQGLITVLQLLIDNALKFSEKDVLVDARLDSERSQIVISVQDYGIGIADDKLGGIFDPFVQLDGSSTRRFGGTGIGLAIVKLILDYHKSIIHVKSELGAGSIFTFSLPAVWMGTGSR